MSDKWRLEDFSPYSRKLPNKATMDALKADKEIGASYLIALLKHLL